MNEKFDLMLNLGMCYLVCWVMMINAHLVTEEQTWLFYLESDLFSPFEDLMLSWVRGRRIGNWFHLHEWKSCLIDNPDNFFFFYKCFFFLLNCTSQETNIHFLKWSYVGLARKSVKWFSNEIKVSTVTTGDKSRC